MHFCRVKTNSVTIVDSDFYQNKKTLVESGSFSAAIQKAKEDVMMRPFKTEKRQYQDDFALPIKRNMFGLLLVQVNIEYTPCILIIDTGAQISGIKDKKANELHLHYTDGALEIGSIGGKMKKMKGICANHFQLGALEFHQLPMIALDDDDFSLRFGKMDLFGFDGILGWDILSQLDFEIDDIAKKLFVLNNRFRIDHPNFISGGFPLILAKRKDGNYSVMGLDTGSKVSWLGENTIKKSGYEIAQEGKALSMGVHGMEQLDLKIIKKAEFFVDRAKITLYNTMTGRTRLFDNFMYDGVFGNEIFRDRRIRIINSRGMILLA